MPRRVSPAKRRVTARLGSTIEFSVTRGFATRGLNEMLLAAQLGESDPQLYVDVGDAEQGLGRSADAHAAYQTALKIDPYFVPARQRLAGKGVPASG